MAKSRIPYVIKKERASELNNSIMPNCPKRTIKVYDCRVITPSQHFAKSIILNEILRDNINSLPQHAKH